MKFIDDLLGKLFPKENKKGVPFISEVLTRRNSFRTEYEQWTIGRKKIVRKIALALAGKNDDDFRAELMRSSHANGFVIFFDDAFVQNDFIFFFEFLREKIIGLNYKQSLADRKFYVRDEYVESIERYYLKPNISPTDDSTPAAQLYGNALLELIFIDDKPLYIKVLLTSYSGFHYQKTLDFEDFLHQIFEL
jgi:hypothetical protein